MRPTTRLLARYLEAGTPTGLTGLWTHATPRSTLLYLYSKTLNRLEAIPETSMYRQSVEAVTKHRMSLVQSIEPPGHKEWATKTSEILKDKGDHFRIRSARPDGSEVETVKLGDSIFAIGMRHKAGDVRTEEWNGLGDSGPALEGVRKASEKAIEFEEEAEMAEAEAKITREFDLPIEPQLTADQISELEHKIGAGLIEEVIQVAEGELKLVDTMEKSKSWEDLDEKPKPGQWEYFERHSM